MALIVGGGSIEIQVIRVRQCPMSKLGVLISVIWKQGTKIVVGQS